MSPTVNSILDKFEDQGDGPFDVPPYSEVLRLDFQMDGQRTWHLWNPRMMDFVGQHHKGIADVAGDLNKVGCKMNKARQRLLDTDGHRLTETGLLCLKCVPMTSAVSSLSSLSKIHTDDHRQSQAGLLF